MLDAFADQGASLRQALPQAPARLITLVSQGQPDQELPLLWQLCQALQDYGYPPVVLDGTSLESDQHPGLTDLMQHTPWGALGATQDSDWAVMPAAAGLRALGREGGPPLARLGHLFRGCGVLLVYARAELLLPVLAGSCAQPVLTLTPDRGALVRGYRTLKQFHLAGRVAPTLVALADARLRQAEQSARRAGRSLQKCALTYLGCEADMITVRSAPQAEHRSDDVRRLALRLLEGGNMPFSDAGWAH